MRNWLVLAVTLLLAAIVGVWASRPPAPLPADAPAAAFSAGRAMADVRVIARAPHPTGSAANARVRDHLVARLQALGFEVRTVTAPLAERPRAKLRRWGSPAAETAQAVSIVALRPGRDPAAPAVAMMAHYDSVWASPGAADDAAGVAATLEIARAIPRAAQARDLVVLLTDAEELGLVGARAFFAAGNTGDPLAGRIGAVVNLETRGGAGRAYMFEGGSDNGAMMRLFARAVADPSTTSMAVKIYELLPNSTDFTPVRQRGIAGFNFAFTGGAWMYHSPLATPDSLDRGSLQHLGSQALDVTRALVTVAELPARAPDVVFGDVLGLFTIVYPPALGWGLLGLAALGLVVAARATAPQWGWRGVVGGAADGLVFAVLAGVLLYLGNLLSGADGPVIYYDRLAALPRLEAQALLLLLAGGLLALAMRVGQRTLWEGWLGAAALVLAVASALQGMLPIGAAIYTWPLLLAVLAMLVGARVPTPGLGPIAAALVAVVALAWGGGLAHGIMLGVGGPLPSAVAVFAPLVLLLVWPLLPPVPRRGAALAALALVLAAGSVALWVRLDPVAASVPPYRDKA